MQYFTILVLAVVQGITEFLPISSDGHLVVGAALFEAATGRHLDNTLTVEIMLHAGTLLSILVVYWQRFWRMLLIERRAIGLLIVGTLPAVVVGLPLKKYGEHLLESPLAAGLGLIVTGGILIWGSRRATGDRDYTELRYSDALVIGLFQAAAILPGVSRSGLTISSGLALCRLKPDAAANFSFLLAIPAIGGAVVLGLLDLYQDGIGSTPLAAVAAGTVVSFVVGLAALLWLLAWLRKGRLHFFAWWCIPLGIAVTVWQLLVPML